MMLETEPRPWVARASCAGLPVNWFMPNEDGTFQTLAEAKRVCDKCPVKQECLDYALAQGSDTIGLWGGTTQRDRKLIHKGATREKKPIEHGTLHGFYRERRGGDTPCAACRQAYLESRNDREKTTTVLLGELLERIHEVTDDPQGT